VPILRNQRWELFSQQIAQGKTNTEAYITAGFKPSRKNASRLRASAVARERGQAAAMFSASALRAKLAGLMVERVEVGHPGAFEDCNSMADIADGFLASFLTGEQVTLTERDRQGLTELIEQQWAEVKEYIAAIRARPVAGRIHPRSRELGAQTSPHHQPQR
jgi:glutathione S-transferase